MPERLQPEPVVLPVFDELGRFLYFVAEPPAMSYDAAMVHVVAGQPSAPFLLTPTPGPLER